MKRFSFALALCTTIACGGKTTTSASLGGDPKAIVATVDNISISDAELSKAAEDQLRRMKSEIYRIKKRVLDDLIEKKLFERAASGAGMSLEEYLKAEVDAKVTEPSEGEMKALYEARKTGNDAPFENVKGQIANYLKQSRKAGQMNQLAMRLRGAAEIKINLEPPRSKVDIAGAPFKGPKDAKVTLVEYSDYECPFCKRVRPAVQQVLEDYKDDVKYVFMDFPLSFHENSQKAHEAAYCAGDQGKYFEFNDKLFSHQQQLGIEDLKGYAKDLQLDTKTFVACLDSDKHAERVRNNIESGSANGVSGTPGFFINGIFLSGARPYQDFKDIIDSELKR